MVLSVCFFFNDTATTEIYTLSLHDALPISQPTMAMRSLPAVPAGAPALLLPVVRSTVWRSPSDGFTRCPAPSLARPRSEEHTSELQSRQYLVCRLLLEKKKNTYNNATPLLN